MKYFLSTLNIGDNMGFMSEYCEYDLLKLFNKMVLWHLAGEVLLSRKSQADNTKPPKKEDVRCQTTRIMVKYKRMETRNFQI